jgi:hypothetical protein
MGHMIRWSKAEGDNIMHQFGEKVLKRAVEEAKEMGLYYWYIY